jgi:hypothetical protein
LNFQIDIEGYFFEDLDLLIAVGVGDQPGGAIILHSLIALIRSYSRMSHGGLLKPISHITAGHVFFNDLDILFLIFLIFFLAYILKLMNKSLSGIDRA